MPYLIFDTAAEADAFNRAEFARLYPNAKGVTTRLWSMVGPLRDGRFALRLPEDGDTRKVPDRMALRQADRNKLVATVEMPPAEPEPR